MKANPGGVIEPSQVYGRDGLIAELWRQLDQTCVLINAERRIGKTSVLRKMSQEGAQGWFPVLLDLERFHSAEEFAIAVYEQVQQYLSRWRRVANTARKVYEEHEFEHIKKTSGPRPWKDLLTAAIRDLCAEKQEVRPVFLWDEVPYMIDHIRRARGEQAAVEVLDTLRSLRQEHADLRMVFSGSIGLHHVLVGIRDGKMSSEPVNDMYQIEVPPLAMADAVKLAEDLIRGEGLSATNAQVGRGHCRGGRLLSLLHPPHRCRTSKGWASGRAGSDPRACCTSPCRSQRPVGSRALPHPDTRLLHEGKECRARRPDPRRPGDCPGVDDRTAVEKRG